MLSKLNKFRNCIRAPNWRGTFRERGVSIFCKNQVYHIFRTFISNSISHVNSIIRPSIILFYYFTRVEDLRKEGSAGRLSPALASGECKFSLHLYLYHTHYSITHTHTHKVQLCNMFNIDVGSVGGSSTINASSAAGKRPASAVQSDKGGDGVKLEGRS